MAKSVACRSGSFLATITKADDSINQRSEQTGQKDDYNPYSGAAVQLAYIHVNPSRSENTDNHTYYQ
jgi:hypothetical protein